MAVNHTQHWLEGLFFKKWDSDLRFRIQIKGLQYVKVYSCEALTHANHFLFVFKPNCRTNSWSNHCGDFAMEYVRESHQSTVFSTQINNNYQGFNDTVPKTECQWNILTWKGRTGLNLLHNQSTDKHEKTLQWMLWPNAHSEFANIKLESNRMKVGILGKQTSDKCVETVV